MELFTHTFNPWREKNGTRVVAAESAWKLPLKWSKAAALAEDLWRSIGGDTSKPGTIDFEGTPATWHRPRVFPSLCDPFEDWQGPMVDSRGHVVKVNRNGPTSDWVWYADTLRVGQNVATMSDVRRRLFRLIDATPNLDYLLLTKRPENIGKMMPPRDLGERDEGIAEGDYGYYSDPDHAFRRSNLWLGTSVENQATADERIPHLLRVPAAVRFLSVEPLLGPVDLRFQCHAMFPGDPSMCDTVACRCRGIDWVIIGGESGPDARPCRVEWIRDLVRQCREAGVPFFVKQLGTNVTSRLPVDEIEVWPNHDCGTGPVQFSGDGFGNYRVLGLRDRKGGDPAEWPADLRVRQMPSR